MTSAISAVRRKPRRITGYAFPEIINAQTNTNMKTILLGLIVATAQLANASLYTYQFGSTNSPLGVTVTDGSVIGVRNDQSVSGITISPPEYSDVIRGVAVTLRISGGYNGDLYGYLVAPDGTHVDLLNRIGTAPLGNMSSGLSVRLDDAAATRIQDLNTGTGNGGSFQASGNLSDFNNHNAMGTWTLFLADMSGGDGSNVSSLVSWGLELN